MRIEELRIGDLVVESALYMRQVMVGSTLSGRIRL